jgi:hypothetical protein
VSPYVEIHTFDKRFSGIPVERCVIRTPPRTGFSGNTPLNMNQLLVSLRDLGDRSGIKDSRVSYPW